MADSRSAEIPLFAAKNRSVTAQIETLAVEAKSVMTSRVRWLHFALLAAPIVIVLIGAWRYRWLSDDSLIDLRVARNILTGHGPVFNPGERVEAYTNPLWVAALVLAHYVLWFVPMNWSAVLMGIALTGIGFYFAERAGLQLLRRSDSRFSLPIGLYVVSSVAVVWEFATSGLETGMVFAWIGVSWWLVARALDRSNFQGLSALFIGCGPLIRPDLALFTLVFLSAFVVVRQRSDLASPTRVGRRWWVIWLFAAAPNVVYELFRIAYFGLLVANTAIVKSAFSPWISQGVRYLNDFQSNYWLWLPVTILLILFARQNIGRWRHGRQNEALAFLAPVVGGVLSIGYVTFIGGDFMHGRMLLPGFFSIMAACWISPPRALRQCLAPATVLIWCAVALCALRWSDGTPANLVIKDERVVEYSLTLSANPVSMGQLSHSVWYRYGEALHRLALRVPRGSTVLVVAGNPSLWYPKVSTPHVFVLRPSFGHYRVIAASRPIGQVGYASGPSVYIFDELSLANPISSHFTASHYVRPGHDKIAPLSWELARFGSTRDVAAINRGANGFTYYPITVRQVRAAQRAIHCGELGSYLSTITRPLSLGTMASNFLRAFGWTTMSFSSNPTIAQHQLCRS
jgi:arabinofuranosyltransferase